jgi:hypothetical protein
VIAAVAATVLASGALAGVWVPHPGRDRLLRGRLRAEVIVTLRSGMAFRGVLFEADARSVVLRNAVALGRTGDGVHHPVDGEVLVARADVEFFQRP